MSPILWIFLGVGAVIGIIACVGNRLEESHYTGEEYPTASSTGAENNQQRDPGIFRFDDAGRPKW